MRTLIELVRLLDLAKCKDRFYSESVLATQSSSARWDHSEGQRYNLRVRTTSIPSTATSRVSVQVRPVGSASVLELSDRIVA